MNNKFILLGFVLILLSSFVSATDFTTNNLFFYLGDNNNFSDPTIYDYATTVNGTATGTVNTGTYFDLNGVGDKIVTPAVNSLISHSAVTVSIWAKVNAITDKNTLVNYRDATVSNTILFNIKDSSTLYGAGSGCWAWNEFAISGANFLDGNIHQFIYSWNGTNLVLQYDTTVSSSLSCSGTMSDPSDNAIKIGYGANQNSYTNMDVYSVSVYNYAMDLTERNELNALGKDYNPYIVEDPFELTASDAFNATAIQIFNATFVNTTSNVNVTTTNGSIFYDLNYKYNLTVQSLTYFNRTYVDYNTSTDLSASIYLIDIFSNTWNMTSDGGCTDWRTNKSTYCQTTDGTPTVTFDTVGATNCSISTSNLLSYNSTRKCGTTGTTEHICTVIDADKLIYGLQDLYVQCENGVGDSSLSGSLAINMTAGSGGGLISCITVVGDGCAAVITDNCAAIISS